MDPRGQSKKRTPGKRGSSATQSLSGHFIDVCVRYHHQLPTQHMKQGAYLMQALWEAYRLAVH